MKKWGYAIPRTSVLKILQFYLAATYWFLFLRPIEKRWQEIKEAKNDRE